MRKKARNIRSNMSLDVIGGLVALLLLFGVLVCVIGNSSFVSAFRNEYATVTYHMADAATGFINGDHIDDYLAGREQEEYALTRRRLDILCHKLNVSLIYVIKVDTSDYGRFVNIVNPVNNEVDDSSYTEWELGYQRETTNDEYRQKYRAIYEEGSPYETLFRLRTTDGQHPHITTLAPVKNSAGEVTAILCMQRPVREMAEAFEPYFKLIIVGVLTMVLAVCVLASNFLKLSVIEPIETVSAEATRFAEEHTQGKPLGELGRYDVIRDLAASIDTMETDMVKYVEDLTAITAEREKMSAELAIAAKIQNDALPDEFPAFPDRYEFDLYASMDPAREVGGDFYNFFLLDDDHLALVMADVSGKGIPGALFMMVNNIMIRARAERGGTPAEMLHDVNEGICQHNDADMFITVWLGILEISTGRLIAANAGHEYPAICRKDGSFELIRGKHGFVLGGMEGTRYRDVELQLNRGDKLFLYTDGLPETTNSDNQLFGTDRMLDALNEFRTQTPKEILEGIQRKVDAFQGEAPQFDDLTMLCIEMKDGPQV